MKRKPIVEIRIRVSPECVAVDFWRVDSGHRTGHTFNYHIRWSEFGDNLERHLRRAQRARAALEERQFRG